MDRFVPEWGEILGLGELRRRPYVCSGFVAMARDPGERLLELMEQCQSRVEFERTFFAGNDPDYPLLYLDQDVLNAILASRVDAERALTLPYALAPMPPFAGLALLDEESLRCGYADGTETWLVHHFGAKPWLDPDPRRCLLAAAAATARGRRSRDPRPSRRRPAAAAPGAASLRRAQADRSQRAAALAAGGSRPMSAPGTAFYCMSSDVYFLGAVGDDQLAAPAGPRRADLPARPRAHRPAARAARAPRSSFVEAPAGVAPWLAKTIAPLRHPAEVMVLIDADMIATRPLGELIERAREGKVVAFENDMDRFVPEWGEILGLGELRRRPYVCSGFVAMARDPGERLLELMERMPVAGRVRAHLLCRQRSRLPAALPRPGRAQRDPGEPGRRRSGSCACESRMMSPLGFGAPELVDERALRCRLRRRRASPTSCTTSCRASPG